jgi:hypothetical protein
VRDLIEDMKKLTERRARKRKGPQATLGSLQRWLKGATPAIKAYSNTVTKFANHYKFKDEKAEAACIETANILRDMEAKILRLRDTVDTALSEF